MTTTAPAIVTTASATGQKEAALTDCDRAARAMYDAEVALHIAHQTQVDAWIAAASDRLHEAILAHTRAVQEASTRSSRHSPRRSRRTAR